MSAAQLVVVVGLVVECDRLLTIGELAEAFEDVCDCEDDCESLRFRQDLSGCLPSFF